MIAFPYIPVPSTCFLDWRTRQAVQFNNEDSPMQKIKKYRQKLMPANILSKCLILGVGSYFPLCYQQATKR